MSGNLDESEEANEDEEEKQEKEERSNQSKEAKSKSQKNKSMVEQKLGTILWRNSSGVGAGISTGRRTLHISCVVSLMILKTVDLPIR